MTHANEIFSPLFADAEVAELFGSDKYVAYFKQFEIALAIALGENHVVDKRIAILAADKINEFAPDFGLLGQGTLVDGVPIPAFVRALKDFVGPELSKAIHVGATSQDLVDTATIMIMRALSDILSKRLTNLDRKIHKLNTQFGAKKFMARTRMQAALQISAADRIGSWKTPLLQLRAELPELRNRCEKLQFGGAVGTRKSLGENGNAVAQQIANHLNLSSPKKSWHSARGPIVEYGTWLSQISGTLGKIGMDICLMSQQGIEEIKLSGGGESSAMPHKQNPVLGETLVALARYNATQISALHHSLVHEQERSGMAWTLEWLVLPQMAQTTGRALNIANVLMDQVERIGA